MRFFATVLITVAGLMSSSMAGAAESEADRSSTAATRSNPDDDSQADVDREVLDSNLNDPASLLPEIRERRAEKDSLLPVSPLFWLHDFTDSGKKWLYDSTGIQLGADITHLFQGLSEALPGHRE